MRPPASSCRVGQRGSSIIEFLVCSLLFLLVIFAGIEFDRMAFVYTNLQDAAKAGARYAITHGSNHGTPSGPGNTINVENWAKNSITGIDTSKLTITVTYSNPTGCYSPPNGVMCHVTVTAQYPYDPWVLLPLSVTLTTSSEGAITF